MFSKAIVRPPAASFAQGLTGAHLGTPDLKLALEQHERYCAALDSHGLELVRLPPDSAYPDSTFVEDTAILTERGSVLCRPGAPSRAGETAAIRSVLESQCPALDEIVAPGSVDGGDICDADGHFFIGLSARTNEAGAQQLAAILARWGYASSIVDIRGIDGILHLKSGIAYLGEHRVVLIDALARHDAFARYEHVRVAPSESYAANCVRVNDRVLIAAGYPRFEGTLQELEYDTIALDMSEFRKMDGGLSCLSLRF